MNGAEALVRTAAAAGVDVCFANPGTTELPIVRALDAVPAIRPVLGLFEGVCTGAADGYGRMTGRPALTLLHLGPGLANGLANLHNARRGRTPVVNLVGDQATWHVAADAPLTSDIDSLARPVSGWLRTASSSRTVAADLAEAVAAASAGVVATLVVPADCQWSDADGPAAALSPMRPPAAAAAGVAAAAEALGGRTVLLLGGSALSERGLLAAGRVASATGARLLCETFPARMERGGGLPAPERLPYFPDAATAALVGAAALVVAGAAEPVSFFGYPGQPSSLVPAGTPVEVLARPEQDAAGALEALADRVCGEAREGVRQSVPSSALPTGPLTPTGAGLVLAAGQPAGAIVVDEAATSGLPWWKAAATALPHTYLGLTGGAIGQGLPCATGAAIACPDRPVIAFQADGAGMYTLQALWTQARERLDVTTLICANRSYRILVTELSRAGVSTPGPAAHALTDLHGPVLDWVRLAEGMGVPGVRVETTEALRVALERSLAESGPHLIEMVLSG